MFINIILYSGLTGCVLVDSVVALVIGRSRTCTSKATGQSNMFSSTAHYLEDDDCQDVGPTDFSRNTYEQLIRTFSMPSDWVLNISISSGKSTLSSLLLLLFL